MPSTVLVLVGNGIDPEDTNATLETGFRTADIMADGTIAMSSSGMIYALINCIEKRR